MKREVRWCLAAVIVFLSCFAVNVGYSWWDVDPKLYHLAATALYISFWTSFTVKSTHSRPMTKGCCIVAAFTLAAAVFGSLVRAPISIDVLLLPALLLAPFSTVPMYGLRHFFDWPGLETVSIVLSSIWLFYSLKKLHKG